jgi:sirohydrochlorin ferrochelatase
MTRPALLAISHGTSSAAGQAAVARLVAAVAERLPDVTVRLGHVDVQQPDVATALASLGRQPVVVVPLLLSAGYHVHVDLVRAAASRPDTVVTPPLGPDPRLAVILAERLGPLEDSSADAPASTDPPVRPDPPASTPAPADEVVLAVAGSSDDRANDDCRAQASLLSALLGRPVRIGFLAAAMPRLADAIAQASAQPSTPAGTPARTQPSTDPTTQATAGARRPVVASYLLTPGYFHDLTVAGAPGIRVAPPLLLPGEPPPPGLVEVVIDRYRAAARPTSSRQAV